MSVEGNMLRGARTAGQPLGQEYMTAATSGKLQIGLPAMKQENSIVMSTKSMSVAGFEKISLYKNDEERQSVMKQINDH